MNRQAPAGTELVKLMLISLNVDDRCIQPQNRFDQDMGLSVTEIERLYTMVEDCFQIQLNDEAIHCLNDLMYQVSPLVSELVN